MCCSRPLRLCLCVNLVREEKAGLAARFHGGAIVPLPRPLEEEHQAVHGLYLGEAGIVQAVDLFHLCRGARGGGGGVVEQRSLATGDVFCRLPFMASRVYLVIH